MKTEELEKMVRARIERLQNWITHYPEFEINFSELTDNERFLIFGVLDSMCRELDGYKKDGGMRSAAAMVIRQEIEADMRVRDAMRDPADLTL